MWQAWTGQYEAHGDPQKADCLIGFSFGYRGGRAQGASLAAQATARRFWRKHPVSPGLSNEDLAAVAARDFAHLPKIMQFEIADAYGALKAPGARQVERIEHHRDPQYYLDSREVAVQARAIMRARGWRRAIILAHPNHIPRLDLICARLGIRTIVTGVERGAVEFDPRASQKWTRNLQRWRGYEPLVLVYYWLKGWV
jgi:hypothetical protein